MCTQLSVQQNYPLNDAGTGQARPSRSSFQPLDSSIGAITTPAQNTEAALASMGQGGHTSSQGTSLQSSQQQQANPYFRCARQ